MLRQFGAGVPAADIDARIAEAARAFEGARITSFVPLFVERRAGQRLAGA